MLSSQQHVITQAARWLAAGDALWLCTILRTWGSSPRPPGAMMACSESGELAGSLSGGCIEEDLLQQLQDGTLKQRYKEEGGPFTIRYGATEEEQARLKLPCGGELHVLLEFIAADSKNKNCFKRMADDLVAHRSLCRQVNLKSGEVSCANVDATAEAVLIKDDMLRHRLSPMYQLLLLGAGDVARYVAELALALEYKVTLCDPRPRYLEGWQMDGVETSSRLPDDVVRENFNDAYSGIIALAHDPRVDDMALMEALKTDAFYVGAMGSARTSAARRQRLPELGLSKAQIARLHAPIGLPIHSKTPAEIAIAVMAQVTAVRHGGKA